MTDKAKLEEIKKLADAMYYAAFNLTTDASLLRKAMNEYHQFVIHKYCKEEPVSEDFEKKFISFVNATHDNNGSYSLHDFAQILYNIAKEELKEPVSDDLEEAAIEICSKVLEGETVVIDGYEYVVLSDAEECFKAGAKWQQAKDESTTEDLGDYINELSKQFPEVSFAKLSRIAVRVAKWHKEQMMAKAIDATICLPYENDDGGYTHLVDVSRPLPVGDNKIAIIFKED